MLKGVKRLSVAKGKECVEIDVATTRRSDLAAMLFGPTGNLRAPALRRGARMVVGFHATALANLLE